MEGMALCLRCRLQTAISYFLTFCAPELDILDSVEAYIQHRNAKGLFVVDEAMPPITDGNC
jgi:hypothetical protein